MKLWKWVIKCPLLVLLLAGWAGLTVYTWSEGKLANALENDVVQNPVFTALMEQDVDLPDEAFIDMDGLQTLTDREDGMSTSVPDGAGLDTGSDGGDAGDGSGGQAGGNVPDTDGIRADDSGGQAGEDGWQGKAEQAADSNVTDGAEEEVGVTRFKEYKKKRTDSPYYTDPGKKALTTDYSYQEVDKSYFDDALFIGDSRTVGMQDYSGLDNAAFFAKTGLNVYELLEDKFVTDPSTGKETSVAHMLKEYQYGKIYLMIGINELGTGNTGTFQKAYSRVIRKIRKWQPDAIIYIQGIIPVSKAKTAEDAIFNNVNINDKNVAIAQLADGKDIFYLDVSAKLTDKKGCLKADYTFDEVHMYAQYYELWTKYLMKHAVVRE